MKALILRAGGNDPHSQELTGIIASSLKNHGAESDVIDLQTIEIRTCTGCFRCWYKHPGRCAQKDGVEAILRKELECEILIYVTPVRWGCYAPELKMLIERSIPQLLPFFDIHEGEVHHLMRYSWRPRLAVFGYGKSPSPEEHKTFQRLIERNNLNFHTARMVENYLNTDITAGWPMEIGKALHELL